ncbi:uncharacterized protein LOC107624285 isoform X2 [Arachis ipaensis]|nr:uncharacterized protein LOC107624285 isoform X2 [Arachis ipaensis]XP_025631818.1 uncharacterized protein LOC112726591 isoform X2 [Arachis hypogaea]QHO22606.1 uncharacterized protein DS421_12g356710 [Arachis hypogaea]
MKTKARLSKSLDHDATMAETFKYIHTLKENMERFADQRATDHYELYTQRLDQSQPTGDDGNNSAASVVDPDMVRNEAASVPYKNRVYGLGSFFADNLSTSTLRHLSSSATSGLVNHEYIADLREQVLLLTQSLHQQAPQLRESEERFQAILSHMTNTNDLRLEWRQEIEQFQRMEHHMAPYEYQMRNGSSGTASGSDAAGGTQILPPWPPPQ